MTDLNALKAANGRRWAAAKLTRAPEFGPVAKRLVAAKQRYVTVQNKTGVPWFFIAVVHERESSQNFNGQLGQGDPLHSVSVHVPAGRGPFSTWEESAFDALVNCNPFSARCKDWSIGSLLTECEKYNGLGYANKGVPSPYVWSGTDQYHSGKYVRDGVYDPNVVDKQLGCAGLLMAMMALDSSIVFTGQAPPKVILPTSKPLPPDVPKPPAPPSITNPSPGSIGAFIASIFNAVFRRK